MSRLEKCILLKERGYSYNPETGKIFGVYGREIKNKDGYGYISITGLKNIKGNIKGHHFAYFMVYGNLDFEMLDHINRIKDDNRICNLRKSNKNKNPKNVIRNGFKYDKRNKKKPYIAQITNNGKTIYLGSYKTEEEARQSYLSAKLKYH